MFILYCGLICILTAFFLMIKETNQRSIETEEWGKVNEKLIHDTRVKLDVLARHQGLIVRKQWDGPECYIVEEIE